MQVIDLVGQKFGKWIVLNRAGRHHIRNRIMWFCMCECGVLRDVVGDSLRIGASQSCGCLRKERTSEASRTHGATGSRTYVSWASMIQRCSNPKNTDYHSYGGRGISVCSKWVKSFEEFYSHMGERPEGLTLDRIDNEGNYEPGNCRWATTAQQAINTRRVVLIECNNEMLPVTIAARKVGLSHQTVFSRIKAGWLTEELLIPAKSRA